MITLLLRKAMLAVAAALEIFDEAQAMACAAQRRRSAIEE
jgi:hypothetical protein